MKLSPNVVLDFYISRIKINHFQIENIKGIANDIRKAIERTTGKRRKKFYQKLQLNLEEQKKIKITHEDELFWFFNTFNKVNGKKNGKEDQMQGITGMWINQRLTS